MITFTVNEQGRKIFKQFLLKLKIIVSVSEKNIRGILLTEKKIRFSLKFLTKLGITLIMLDWLFFSLENWCCF